MTISAAKKKVRELEEARAVQEGGILLVRLMPDGNYLHNGEIIAPDEYEKRAAKASNTIIDDIPG